MIINRYEVGQEAVLKWYCRGYHRRKLGSRNQSLADIQHLVLALLLVLLREGYLLPKLIFVIYFD